MKKSFYSIFIIFVVAFFCACENPFFQDVAGLYEVSFETNGGSKVESVTTNRIQAEPKTAKANCDFLGWYEKSDFSEAAVTFPYEPKEATVLYARWNQKYTVNFVTNCDMVLESVVASALNEPSSLVKTDFTFAGWYTDSSFAGEKVSFPLVLTKDLTLYARWIQNYTVTFNSNGGSEVESVKTGILSSLPEPAKENYEFAGWFTSASLSGNAITVPFSVEKDVTLYAKWLPTYLVSFETNGGSEIASFMARTIEIVATPEKSGFTFIAWYSDSALTKKVEFPLTLTADITFYAEYKENFTVTFETNGGTALSDVNSYVVENSPESTKANCMLSGWYTNADFTDESKVSFPFYPGEDITLYAKWVKEMWKITYDANGATGGTVPESVKGSSTTVSSNSGALTKTGYAFTNWNTSKDGTSGQSYSAGTKITPAANVTLYAQWGKDYAAMIDVEGGTFLMGTPDSTSRPTITLSSFRIAQYELTYELWKEVYTWATTEKNYVLRTAKKGYATNDEYKSFVPATYISWNSACVWLNAYSEYKGLEPVYYRGSSVWRDYSSTSGTFNWDKTKNGYRLPTECEWEYASNGGKYLSYTTYSGSNTIYTVAWYYSNSGKEMHPVGTRAANKLGIYDMSGNAAEWCYDYYAAWGTGELANPVHESGSYRCYRGGALYDNDTCCTIFFRNYWTYGFDTCSSDIGLRIAQNYTE